jgi:subtilisin family serine protease
MKKLQTSISRYIDPVEKDGRVKRVRIAILDSGLDTEHPFLDPSLEGRRILKKQSFISGTASDDVQDKIGHGTHSLGLLLKVGPHAEICVARIARDNDIYPADYDNITKARLSHTRADSFGIELMTRAGHQVRI